jgi:hypothetical protein
MLVYSNEGSQRDEIEGVFYLVHDIIIPGSAPGRTDLQFERSPSCLDISSFDKRC